MASSNRTLSTALQASRALRSSYAAGSRRYASSSTSTSTSAKGKAKASSPSSDPSSSSTGEAEWTPALPEGRSAAYDLSLQYLRSHRDSTLARISSSSTPAEVDRLTIEAYVNDPATRRMFRDTNGEGQMDKVVFRHLAQSKWKKEGGLDLLMQRVHQLGVVPDLLAGVGGHVAPLRILDGKGKEVEPGFMELPSRWSSPPDLRVQLFDHPSPPSSASASPTANYTLLVVDLDSPSPETQSYEQRIHYAKSDIPLGVLSGTQNLFDAAQGKEVLPYEPPTPEQGTGKHRYAFLLIRQPASLNLPSEREGWVLREWMLEQGLSSEDVVAVTLFRAKWTPEEDAYIKQAYLDARGVEMPVYSKPPKEARYGYPLSAKAKRAEGIRQAAWEEAVAELEDIGGEVEQLERGRQAATA